MFVTVTVASARTLRPSSTPRAAAYCIRVRLIASQVCSVMRLMLRWSVALLERGLSIHPSPEKARYVREMGTQLLVGPCVQLLEHRCPQHLLGRHALSSLGGRPNPVLQILQNKRRDVRMVSQDPIDPFELAGVTVVHDRAAQRKLVWS